MGDPTLSVKPSKVVRTDLMPAHVLDDYNGLLAAGDAAADAGDLEAAKGLWAKAEAVAKPYTETIPETVETPAPSWTCQPKEGLRDSGKPIIVSLAPDVCKTPMGSATPPIPYSITAIPGEDAGTTPTVRMTGQKAFVMRSNTTCVHGDEPGTAKGVKSGTVGDIAEPIDHSTSVRAEGSCIIRHGDKFYMNSRNTQGEAIWCEDMSTNDGGAKTAPPPSSDAPDPPITPETPEEQSWLDRQLAKVGEAYDAVAATASEVGREIAEFDRDNGKVLTRAVGGAEMVAGVVGAKVGVVTTAAGVALTATGAGAIVGVPLAAAGATVTTVSVDTAYAGAKTLATGEFHETYTEKAVKAGVEAAGGTEGQAEAALLAAGILSPGQGLGRTGRKIAADTLEGAAEAGAKKVDDVAEAAGKSADDAAEATVPATTKTGDAIDHGGDNVRITKVDDGSPGTPSHKAQRWEEYQENGGQWDYDRWSKTYDNNMVRARKAHEEVNRYHAEAGWGRREVTVDVEVDGVKMTRRLDIADAAPDNPRGVEFKTGYQTANQSNLSELARDEALVRNGWDIEWVVKGKASEPLKKAIEDSGVTFKGEILQ